MKKTYMVIGLVFFVVLSAVHAKITIQTPVNASAGTAAPLRVIIEKPGHFGLETYERVAAEIEIIGPAQFKTGSHIFKKEYGRIENETVIFDDDIELQRIYTDAKSSIAVVATATYNLRKIGLSGWVVEEKRSTISELSRFEIDGFQIVNDQNDVEDIARQNTHLNEQLLTMRNKLAPLEKELTAALESIAALEKNIADANAKIAAGENQRNLKVGLLVNFGILTIIFLVLWLFEKSKNPHQPRKPLHFK